jgi:hypothetical protein
MFSLNKKRALNTPDIIYFHVLGVKNVVPSLDDMHVATGVPRVANSGVTEPA